MIWRDSPAGDDEVSELCVIFDKIFATNLTYHTQEILSREWYCDVNMCKYVSYIIDTINKDASISDLLNPVKKIHTLLDNYNQGKLSEIDEDQI